MARRNFDSTDMLWFMNNQWPTVGTQALTCATQVVSLTTIAATDTVLVTPVTYATAAYVAKVEITAGTGFTVTMSTDPGPAVIQYAVFKKNS